MVTVKSPIGRAPRRVRVRTFELNGHDRYGHGDDDGRSDQLPPLTVSPGRG